jgi:glycogen debranching enzyme
LTEVQKSLVLKRVQQELLTERGIRTLSPVSPHFKGEYDGDEFSRNSAYHMGTARPWLLGFYIDANLKLHGKAFLQKAQELIAAFEEDVEIHCIGSVSEVYDGDPPHQPHGCTSYSISVASLLWSMRLVKEYKSTKI